MKSRPTVLASTVLALALLGDTLLCAALPLHATTFGISLAWAGVLLSANRIVRLFAYPLLPRIAEGVGLRRFTILAAALGAVSTFAFALTSGGWLLLVSRVAWGIAFGGLSLAVLAYATFSHDGAGTRVGLSFSVRELGPILSLTGGVFLLGTFGMRPALAILGAASLLALPLAMHLPDLKIRASVPIESRRRWPTGNERMSLILGLVADGMFPATIALLLAPSAGVSGAAAGAGLLLALKRVAIIVLSPISGRASDRFGSRSTIVAGGLMAAAGTFFVAAGFVVAGSVVLLGGAAITATALPLSVSSGGIPALARMNIARDAGAALGPLLAMALFRVTGPSLLYCMAGALLLACALSSSERGLIVAGFTLLRDPELPAAESRPRARWSRA